MIGCWVDPDFMAKIDSARRGTPRSQFFRDAIADKLKSVGIPVEPEEAQAPDRAGKGGRPRLSSEEKADRRTAQQIVNQRMKGDIADVKRRARKGTTAGPSEGSASPGPVSRGGVKRGGLDATGTSDRGGSPSAVERKSKGLG